MLPESKKEFLKKIEVISSNCLFNKQEHVLGRRIGKKVVQCLSVTHFLSKYITGESFTKAKQYINMDYYADIGTQIHEAIEKGLLKEEFNPQWLKNVVEAKQVVNQYQIETYVLELPISTMYLLGGVMDLIGLTAEGKVILVDWKTSSRPREEHHWQLQLYASLLKTFNIEVDLALCVYTGRKENSKLIIKEYKDMSLNRMVQAAVVLHNQKVIQYGEGYWL